MLKISVMRDDNGGTLPSFAWPGGYPIVYLLADGELLCPECANGTTKGSEASETHDDPGWRIIGADIHWESAPEHCAHCGRDIESAYGDPDAD